MGGKASRELVSIERNLLIRHDCDESLVDATRDCDFVEGTSLDAVDPGTTKMKRPEQRKLRTKKPIVNWFILSSRNQDSVDPVARAMVRSTHNKLKNLIQISLHHRTNRQAPACSGALASANKDYLHIDNGFITSSGMDTCTEIDKRGGLQAALAVDCTHRCDGGKSSMSHC